MAEWFVQIDGKKYGPFDSAKLVKLVAASKVKPDHLVKKGHEGEWKPARQVRRLFDDSALDKAVGHEEIMSGDPRPDVPLRAAEADDDDLTSSSDSYDLAGGFDMAAELTATAGGETLAAAQPMVSTNAAATLPGRLVAAVLAMAKKMLADKKRAQRSAKLSWQMPLFASILVFVGRLLLGLPPLLVFGLWGLSAILGVISALEAIACYCVRRHRDVIAPALTGIAASGAIIGAFIWFFNFMAE